MLCNALKTPPRPPRPATTFLFGSDRFHLSESVNQPVEMVDGLIQVSWYGSEARTEPTEPTRGLLMVMFLVYAFMVEQKKTSEEQLSAAE